MKWFIGLIALVVVAIPAAYAASPNKEKPKPQSAAQTQSSDQNAAKACKAERASMGVDAFAKRYGTNHNLKNAFGKCVSGKSKGKSEAQDNEQGEAQDNEQNEATDDEHGTSQGTSNAAQQCKKERADMGAVAFANKYGTNHNKANAFGKCVSSKAKANGEKDND